MPPTKLISTGVPWGELFRRTFHINDPNAAIQAPLNDEWGVQLVTDAGKVSAFANMERRQLVWALAAGAGVGAHAQQFAVPVDMFLTQVQVLSASANISFCEVLHGKAATGAVPFPQLSGSLPLATAPLGICLMATAVPPIVAGNGQLVPLYLNPAFNGGAYFVRAGEGLFCNVTVVGAPTTALVFFVLTAWTQVESTDRSAFWPEVG